jgi:hypothetical protein
LSDAMTIECIGSSNNAVTAINWARDKVRIDSDMVRLLLMCNRLTVLDL